MARAASGNRLKQRLADEGRVFGTWIMDARHQAIVRQIAGAGFDFVVLEMEHSALSWETIGDFCEMARASGITPVVRPAELTRESILRLLEIGAMGVMFHDVDDRNEVEVAREWILRSKSMLRPDKARQAADGVALVIQIETVKGLEQVDDIVAAGGIDVVEIGRGDLATEMGYPGQRTHPRVIEAIERIVTVCGRHGVAAGVTCLDRADVEDNARRGVRCLSYSTDRYILEQAYVEAMSAFNALDLLRHDGKA